MILVICKRKHARGVSPISGPDLDDKILDSLAYTLMGIWESLGGDESILPVEVL